MNYYTGYFPLTVRKVKLKRQTGVRSLVVSADVGVSRVRLSFLKHEAVVRCSESDHT